jgi:hypothetical protein
VPQDSLDGTEPARLAEMMTLDATPPRLWSPDELGVILRHQLSVPLELDLGEPSGDAATGADSRPMPSCTFADLLHHPEPPLAMLRRAKRFAKACKSDPNGPLPDEVATVLYYATIAVALLRCRQCITAMDDVALRAGFGWALLQVWVDDRTKSIFEEALP